MTDVILGEAAGEGGGVVFCVRRGRRVCGDGGDGGGGRRWMMIAKY